jgi:putative ATP-dependent endonuclease of the OLD family
MPEARTGSPAVEAAARATSGFGLVRVEVRGFRSAHEISFAPAGVCALVGEANAGKSNILVAVRALLDSGAPPIVRGDLSVGGDRRITIRGVLASGETLGLEAVPPRAARASRDGAPATLFLPGSARASSLLAASQPHDEEAARAFELFQGALAEQVGSRPASATAPALSLVAALERCCALGVRGVVLLIEEPELYLRPQAQRYLYRLLREFAAGGNQVIYSTHSPAFLNVARLDELVFVERAEETGTSAIQPPPPPADEEFRVRTEFDAERSELFLARAAVLVEGMTEKLTLPFVFQALGHNHDREAISIVECGGKSGIPFFARICNVVGVPFVAVHDRDARPGKKPIDAERALNEHIAEIAGRERTIVLEPDFEAVAGLRGHTHKPERAWRSFATLPATKMPRQLLQAATLALTLARQE